MDCNTRKGGKVGKNQDKKIVMVKLIIQTTPPQKTPGTGTTKTSVIW
jgi:hypothetical protein